jgi:hypothetical protein
VNKNILTSSAIFITVLISLNTNQTINAQDKEKKELVPTVTIPAPPGSKGFGMPTAADGSPAPRRRWVSASVTEPRDIITTTLVSFPIRKQKHIILPAAEVIFIKAKT